MDIEILRDTPPWDWPKNAGKRPLEILKDPRAKKSDRLIAAELAGDLVVMNDDLAAVVLAILRSPEEPEQLRAAAAIALGPVLEQTDIDGFDDPYAEPSITERTFRAIQNTLQRLFPDVSVPKEVRRRILAQVRHETMENSANPFRMSSGNR